MIRCVEDITDTSVQEMLREHFNDRSLTATLDGEGLKVLGTNCNDHYNSDIKKVTCLVVKDGKEKREMHMIVKLPVMGSMRHFHKIARPLMREVIWYTVAVPTLKKFSDVLSSLLPLVYQGYSVHSKTVLSPPLCERLCCLPCWLPFRKIDGGVLIFEDLTKSASGKSYSCVDKHKVMGLAHITMAVRALGHYHGAWWRFLRTNNSDGGEFNVQDALTVFKSNLPEFMLRGMVTNTFKSTAQLLQNREESEELINKVQRYGKEKAVQQISRPLNHPEVDPSRYEISDLLRSWFFGILLTQHMQTIPGIYWQFY